MNKDPFSYRSLDHYTAALIREKLGIELTPTQVAVQRAESLKRLREHLRMEGCRDIPESDAELLLEVNEAIRKHSEGLDVASEADFRLNGAVRREYTSTVNPYPVTDPGSARGRPEIWKENSPCDDGLIVGRHARPYHGQRAVGLEARLVWVVLGIAMALLATGLGLVVKAWVQARLGPLL